MRSFVLDGVTLYLMFEEHADGVDIILALNECQAGRVQKRILQACWWIVIGMTTTCVLCAYIVFLVGGLITAANAG